jgi:hypothetical protein
VAPRAGAGPGLTRPHVRYHPGALGLLRDDARTGVTGVVNTLSIPIFGRWQSTRLAEMIAPYRDRPPVAREVSVERALAAARAAMPGADLAFMAFPGSAPSA